MDNKVKVMLHIVVREDDTMKIALTGRDGGTSVKLTQDWQEAQRALEKIMPAHLRHEESSAAQSCSQAGGAPDQDRAVRLECARIVISAGVPSEGWMQLAQPLAEWVLGASNPGAGVCAAGGSAVAGGSTGVQGFLSEEANQERMERVYAYGAGFFDKPKAPFEIKPPSLEMLEKMIGALEQEKVKYLSEKSRLHVDELLGLGLVDEARAEQARAAVAATAKSPTS